MAGASISINAEFNDQQVVDAFRRLVDKAENLEPVFADIGEALLNSHRDRWDRQESPDGEPWAKLDPKYQARKKKNAGKVLVLEGLMRDTLAYNVSASRLELGTNFVQGATHQFGDKSRGIPARPFLGISDEDEVEILEILRDHFTL
ncbi:MAG: phage virion morphogenesis protein [Cycloclasticus sp.]